MKIKINYGKIKKIDTLTLYVEQDKALKVLIPLAPYLKEYDFLKLSPGRYLIYIIFKRKNQNYLISKKVKIPKKEIIFNLEKAIRYKIPDMTEEEQKEILRVIKETGFKYDKAWSDGFSIRVETNPKQIDPASFVLKSLTIDKTGRITYWFKWGYVEEESKFAQAPPRLLENKNFVLETCGEKDPRRFSMAIENELFPIKALIKELPEAIRIIKNIGSAVNDL